MSKRFDGFRFVGPIIGSLILLMVVSIFPSCKRVYFAEMNVDESGGEEKELLINARFPLRSEINALFKTSLVDSGIVPVEVVVKNTGERKLVIHHPNSISLPESFWGIDLQVRCMVYQPVRPIEVYAIQAGLDVDSVKAYRVGTSNVVSGMIFAPYGLFLVYNDIRYNRILRAINNRSFFPVHKSGILMPVELNPGDSVKGFVFFDLPGELNPYISSRIMAEEIAERVIGIRGKSLKERAKTVKEKKKELKELIELKADSILGNIVGGNFTIRLTGCFSVSGTEKTSFKGIFPVYEERLCGVSGIEGNNKDATLVNGKSQRLVFIMAGSSLSSRKLSLFPCRVDELEDYLYGKGDSNLKGSTSDDSSVVYIRSRSASICSAVVSGNIAAVAVNFKSSSKVFLWDLEKMKTIHVVRFKERVKRVFIGDSLAILSDRDFVYLHSLRTGERCRYFKFGRDICDALCFRGRIFAVQRNGIVKVADLSTGGANPVTDIDTLSSAERKIVGRFGDRLLLLTRGKWTASLSAYNISTYTEEFITRLPAQPVYCLLDRGKLTLQLPSGTFITYGLTSKMTLKLLSAGTIPFEVSLIVPYKKDELLVAGKGGTFVIRSEGDFEPCSIDRVVAEHVVKVIYPEQARLFNKQ